MESHMSPHDCGQKKKQRCCEMEPSSCWGNWDRKWGSVWGHGVQTQQSEDFVFPTILYSPTRSCCHTCAHTHTHVHTHDCTHGSNPLRLPVLHPPGVKVWYQPICSNHPHNPNSYSCTTPDPLSSFSYLVCATVEGQPRQNTLHRALDQHSQKGSGRRVKWAKKRKTADMKSCLDSSMIHTDILTSLDASNNHSFNHCTFTAMIGNIYVFIFA